jgi:hypothetical protein
VVRAAVFRVGTVLAAIACADPVTDSVTLATRLLGYSHERIHIKQRVACIGMLEGRSAVCCWKAARNPALSPIAGAATASESAVRQRLGPKPDSSSRVCCVKGR